MAHQISVHGVTGAHELTITLILHRLWLSTPSSGEALVQSPPCASELGLHNCSVLPCQLYPYVSLQFLGFLLYLERSYLPQDHKNILRCFIMV